MLRDRTIGRRMASALFFAVLALAQAWFTYVFSAMVTVVSETDWYTINSRWVYPFLTLASCVVFTRTALRCFKRGVASANYQTGQ